MTTGKSTLAESRRAKTTADALQPFVLWAIDQLGLQVAESDGVFRLDVPDGPPRDLGSVRPTSFAFDRAVLGETRDDVELVTADSPLVNSLVGALQASGAVVHARPADQPQSVHEITERLFSAYTIDGGRVHLGGCGLTDWPFLRITVRTPNERSTAGGLLHHIILDARGDIVDEETIEQLGLGNVVPFGENPPKLADAELAILLACGDRVEPLPPGLTEAAQRLVATVIWCKWVEGKLALTIGESVAEQPFSGWAQTLEAPLFVCPHTGAESFHIAATDDGRITVADEIEACAESARRVLRSDLVECSATGVRVLPEFAETCQVTAKPVLRSTLAPCPVCRQLVSSAARSGAGCLACQAMAPVTKDDPRIARLLGEHPGLDRWQHWKLSETTTAYVASATRVMKRLLVVVDKQTLVPVYLADGNRFLSGWLPVAESQYDEFLR